MRVGIMIGSYPERARSERLPGLVADAQAAEAAGFSSMWIPQIPGYLDAMTVIAVLGRATERIEFGTSIVPAQTRHPVAMAQQAITTREATGDRFTLGLGPSHHWIIEDQLGLTYDRPAHYVRNYLDVLEKAFAGPGMVDVDNDLFRVHSPVDVVDEPQVPILLAALAPVMLGLAGSRASGTILWMADEKTVSEHVVPKIGKAAAEAGRPSPRIVACVPVTLCAPAEVDDVRVLTSKVLGHAELSPNYLRLLQHGDAADVGDTAAAGDEAAVEARLRQYAAAGVTDLAARVVPFGKTVEERNASRARTEAFLGTLTSQL